MSTYILVIAYCLLTPLFILWAIHQYKALGKIGSIFLAYAVGCIVGLGGLLPEGSSAALKAVQNFTIPFAIPLMLLSSNVKEWTKLAPSFMKSTLCALVGCVIAICIGFKMFGQENPQSFVETGGLLGGLYTGGNANMASVKMALDIDENLFIEVSAYSIAMSAIYIILIVVFGKNIFGLVLPKFKAVEQDENSATTVASTPANHEDELFYGLFSRDNLPHLFKGLGITIAILLLGLGFTKLCAVVFGDIDSQAIFILSISLMSVLASLKKEIREIPRTFEAGTYLILVFSVAIASQLNTKSAGNFNMNLFMFTAMATIGTVFFHVWLSAILRLDRDTTLATSISLICSPPFVPVIASSVKNQSIIGPGIAVGLLGYAIGTYIGFGVSLLLSSLA